MTDDAAAATEAILRESGALLEGDHFVYVSGQHGSGWIDKDAVYPHTERNATLGRLIAECCADLDADYVCGPATGGLIMAQWTAHARGALAIFGEHPGPTDPESGHRPFILKRGYQNLVDGSRVLVVDDVVNTGASMRGITQAVRDHGGEVVAAAAVCQRGSATPDDLGVSDYRYLVEHGLDSWPKEDCPLCAKGVPVNVDYAHGRDYVDAGGNWP